MEAEPTVTQQQQIARATSSAKSAKSGACSEVGNPIIEIQSCPEHKRPYEAFCVECKVYLHS